MSGPRLGQADEARAGQEPMAAPVDRGRGDDGQDQPRDDLGRGPSPANPPSDSPADGLSDNAADRLVDRPGGIGAGSGSGRWWRGVAVGAVAALPIGWLLSYAGTLPFLLGPFFFALFGILIGAVTHRVAAPGRPYRAGPLLGGTALLIGLVMVETILLESRDFAADMALRAAKRTRTLGDLSIEAFRARTAEGVRGYLSENYPPGGAIGYVRWVVTSGRIGPGELEGVARELTPRQSGLVWATRVVLSVALLVFGIGSQTLNLRHRREPTPRAIDLS